MLQAVPPNADAGPLGPHTTGSITIDDMVPFSDEADGRDVPQEILDVTLRDHERIEAAREAKRPPKRRRTSRKEKEETIADAYAAFQAAGDDTAKRAWFEQRLGCIGCNERTKKMACLPCGHVTRCIECADRMKDDEAPKCDICRKPVASIERVYL